MTRYGFVPHGRVDHGNLCGPCDRAELTFSAGDHGRDRPAPAIAREEPAVLSGSDVVGSGLGFALAMVRSLAPVPDVGFSSPFRPSSAYAESARFAP